MASRLLTRFKSLPADVFRLAQNTLAIPISRFFSGTVETALTPIKVVSRFDLNCLTMDICLENYEKQLRRFPRLNPKVEGCKMRRAVCEVDKFEDNRNFFYVDVTLGDEDLQLLYCTRTAKLVGFKGQGTLVVLGDDSFLQSPKFAQIVGAGVEQIIRKHLYVRADSNYLVLSMGGFKSAVFGLINALRDVNSKWSFKERSHYEECLALLFCCTFGGMQFQRMKNSVQRSLEFGDCGVAGIGFRADAVLLSENWGEISANYLSGEPLWKSFVIADEVSVVKYLPPPMKVCLWNDSTKETAFKESIRQYTRAVRKAAMEAWEEAKGGFDEEDFFEEKGYGKVEEAAARMAWKASVEANL